MARRGDRRRRNARRARRGPSRGGPLLQRRKFSRRRRLAGRAVDAVKAFLYATHIYGPDKTNYEYFVDHHFPNNLPDIWERHFGFVPTLTGKPVLIASIGGRHHGAFYREREWQQTRSNS